MPDTTDDATDTSSDHTPAEHALRGLLIETQAQLSRASAEIVASLAVIEANKIHIAELIAVNVTNLAAARADFDAMEASKNAEIAALTTRVRENASGHTP